MTNYMVTDVDLKLIADAIREKSGSSDTIEFPSGFAEAVDDIETGTDISDTTATAGDVLSGKYFYNASGVKTEGSIAEKAAATYNTSSSDQTISSGQYLSGNQTIKAVTTSNLSAANVKHNVTVKVGDANDDDRIAGVTGTFTSDGTASASDILSGKIAYSQGSKITGNISSKAAATYNTSTSDQTISASQYLSGNQTIKAVTTSNLSAANIKSGVTVKVGDANNAGRIANVTGTYKSSLSVTTQTTTANVSWECSGSYGWIDMNSYSVTPPVTNAKLIRCIFNSSYGGTYDSEGMDGYSGDSKIIAIVLPSKNKVAIGYLNTGSAILRDNGTTVTCYWAVPSVSV